MKQINQNMRTGELVTQNVPDPMVRPGAVLIANAFSLVSAGTEKMLRDLAKKSLLGKAYERPDQVRRVLEKVRNEGLFSTVRQVRTKLDDPIPLGYCSAGIVLACGEGVQHFKPGDRVASNGNHAELVAVPKNLCAHVADNVPLDHAAFAVLGSIALQGVRLSNCRLGETVLVIGLGLVGQVAVALLKAAGCRVLGTDPDPTKCELAIEMGADEARPNMNAASVEQQTGGLGADAVVITASTKSNGPIELAAAAVRKKGRVVLIGVVGLELDRRPFYFKEAEFVVSCSYGPGRYDPEYEEQGRDYPAPYVRWTEQRNIQAVLDMMACGKLDVAPLISHRFALEKASEAYDLISSNSEPYLGIVIEYPGIALEKVERQLEFKSSAVPKGKQKVGVLGAGNFASMVLIPAIKQCGQFELGTICSAGGNSATHIAQKMGFGTATTDEDKVFDDPAIDTVFSITRHDLHARHVVRALSAGKNVFVEKPLCLNLQELEEIESCLHEKQSSPLLMVGFNRRFSPAARQIKEFFSGVHSPLTIAIRFSAGEIPADHWTQDLQQGGGRIIGEACHAIDLATYLAGSPPMRVFCESVAGGSPGEITDDQCFITLRHANGSVSSLGYLAGGDKAFPKERVEVFGGGRVGVIDDFRATTTCSGGKTTTQKMKMDKGHQNEIVALAEALKNNSEPPISWEDLRGVTLASILAVQSLRDGFPHDISPTS